MFRHLRRALALALSLILLAGCSGPAPTPEPGSALAVAPLSPAAAITDAAGLRKAAATALSEQRIYAPAGNNAIEHYLALRRLAPDEATVATALLELLPYALIGSEQAVGRQDFIEARRLLGLIEQADPRAPALSRLRDSIAAAESAAALRVIAEAEAAKLREQQQIAADQGAAELAQQQLAAAVSAAAPAAAAVGPAQPPPAAPAPVAAAPAARTTVPAVTSATTSATVLPQLLSAPPPRYPLMALRRKLEGDVRVEITIQPDGSVAAPRVVSADPPGLFDEAALVAAKRWRYEASGRSVTTTQVLRFRLKDGQP